MSQASILFTNPKIEIIPGSQEDEQIKNECDPKCRICYPECVPRCYPVESRCEPHEAPCRPNGQLGA